MKKPIILAAILVLFSVTTSLAQNAEDSAWTKAEQNTVFMSEDGKSLLVVVASSSKNLQLAVDKASLHAKVLFAKYLNKKTLQGGVTLTNKRISAKGTAYKVLALAKMRI